jgi:hypothetical protein
MSDSAVPQQRVMNCPHCEQPTAQSIMGRVTVPPENPEEVWSEEATYTLLQCEICRDASLQIDVGVFASPSDIPKFVYPAQRQLSDEVPASLRREFMEAQSCFSAKAFTATVVMVRRTLEGICEDGNIKQGTLAKRLDSMKQAALIDATLAEWANGLRVLGNEGAHFTGTQVSRADAFDALDFAEALPDQIYVLVGDSRLSSNDVTRPSTQERVSLPAPNDPVDSRRALRMSCGLCHLGKGLFGICEC